MRRHKRRGTRETRLAQALRAAVEPPRQLRAIGSAEFEIVVMTAVLD